MPTSPTNRQQGFSLVELLVVIVLLAGASALAVASVVRNTPGAQLRRQSEDIAAQLRFVRMRALASGREQQFTISPDGRQWRGADGRRGEFSSDLSVELTGAREAIPGRAATSIAFHPGGCSSGGSIRIAREGAAYVVEVSWLTGAVRLRHLEAAP